MQSGNMDHVIGVTVQANAENAMEKDILGKLIPMILIGGMMNKLSVMNVVGPVCVLIVREQAMIYTEDKDTRT